MSIVHDELRRMGVPYHGLFVLREKDGVTVARVKNNAQSYIVKCFENEGFKREIMNCRLLLSLQIPTMKVLAETDSAILPEDMGTGEILKRQPWGFLRLPL